MRAQREQRIMYDRIPAQFVESVPGPKTKLKTITKHRPQTNNPARMRNRDRETRMKWDDRSTLFPDGLRLKAPVRSQHQDVCRAHACRETTGMTTDHYTRSPDTPPRATASDPHVRARREGEAFAFQPDTPVSSCPSHDPTAQGSLTQTSSCTKNREDTQPRHPSVCGFHSSPGSWPGSTRGSINSPPILNSFLQTQNCAQCLPRDPRNVLRQHICHVIRTEHFL